MQAVHCEGPSQKQIFVTFVSFVPFGIEDPGSAPQPN